jgi:ubiquitin carboxyl-terminal hydrolase 10
LGGLHDECVQVMKNSGTSNSSLTTTTLVNGITSHPVEAPSLPIGETTGGWLEVGPKQRPAVTRSSGTITTESPITKIFGGKLRSELRVPGLTNSVTLEPYQPLQLDIQSPQVNNITDALKNLTRPETLHGDFNSPRGPGTSATKQVFVETLPPVLILHLKRFQYNNTGGTQKIWKKVGYPLELEIPREVFPPHKRGLVAQGRLPKYQLIGVVYHHGKNASGGHYTVDVRRQDGSEWIRLDDTVIRRVRCEDVVEGGSEETSKSSAIPPDGHKNDHGNVNTYELAGPEDGEEAWNDGEGWKQVNGSNSAATGGGKRAWSGGVNGSGTGTNSAAKGKPNEKSSVKDNKVAYLLFYQKTKA